MKASCGGGSVRCEGVVGRYAVACQTTLRSEGQSCSKLVACDAKSMCRVTDEAAPGTCVKLPEGCSNHCDCIEAAPGVCPSGKPVCSVAGFPVTVVCQ